MAWSPDTPPAVQADLENLAGESLTAARHFLDKNGEFYPFGMSVDLDGEIALFSADPGFGEHPESLAVLDALYQAARAGEHEFRAVSFVADVLIDSGDAARCEMEHRDGGPTWAFFLPYERKRFGRGLKYGEPFGQRSAERRVWP